ncbi:biotin synthase [Ruegeria marisrubri]|uniref:Biotin synthase n=1 Tax=Ruegeria marisrubri TaxID=1685379 RepID=A0A0X3TCK5_9RHOB|nr:pimeloyl-ACP methyl esterase BioG family protein [Ruegeria marisrubri]KUJ73423.1 biotin synthase [Ruegeria marisrubri]
MQARWLKNSGADEAIAVFGGWAVGPSPFLHLRGPQDVLFVEDYRDLATDLPDLSSYRRVSLLAWSFGVASYAHWQAGRPDPFARKVAVNGTLHPVDRTFGIPPVAMRKTVETLSPGAYQLFLARAFGAAQPQAEMDVEARQQELRAIEARGDAPATAFDRIWIGTKDKIFPPANMRRAWEGQDVREIPAPHAPFERFETWEEMFA